MTYLIDSRPVVGRTARHTLDAAIVLVGCGGTGGFLADALCRLLIGRTARPRRSWAAPRTASGG